MSYSEELRTFAAAHTYEDIKVNISFPERCRKILYS